MTESKPHQRPKGELEREVRHIAGEVDGWRRDALLEAAGLFEQLETAQAELTEWRTSIATERLQEQLESVRELNRRAEERCAASFEEARGLREQYEAQERELTAARIDVRKAAEIMELLVSKDAPEQADWDDINSWLAASSPAKRPCAYHAPLYVEGCRDCVAQSPAKKPCE